MSVLYKLNIVSIPSTGVPESPLERLKKTYIGRIYLRYLKPIPIIRQCLIRTWCLLYPLYAKLLAFLTLAYQAKNWRNLIKMQDFVAVNHCPCIQIFGPTRVEAPKPKVFPLDYQSLLVAPNDHYIFPPVYVAELGEAMVMGGTNLIFKEDAVICHDLYDFECDYTSEELHGRHLIDPKANRMRLLFQDPMPAEIKCAASFVDACAANYAHWMTEVLPRIAVFCDVPAYARVPIIVNDGLHPNIWQSLFLVVGDKREVIILPIGRTLKVNNLIQTSVTGYVPFERRNKQLDNHSHGVFNPLAFEKLKLRLINCNESETQTSFEKVYLRRNSVHRSVENIKEIEVIISDAGYSFIDPEKLNFLDQVGLMKNANEVVASTGAVLCNAIFCNENSNIVVMMGVHNDMIYRYWANMLQPLGINVRYVLGLQSHKSEKSIHGNYKIDADWLRMMI